MRTFDLFSEALAMIAAHWQRLLIVLVPLYALQWSAVQLGERAMSRAFDNLSTFDGRMFFAFWVAGLGLIVAWSIGAALLAVLWHRLVLHAQKVWPPLSAFGWYLWQAFKLSLLIALFSWGLFALVSMIMATAPFVFFDLFWAIALAIHVLMTWLWLRFGLILPAAALGDDEMTMLTSWFETEGAAWPIFALAVVQGAMWSAINAFDAWSRWTGAQFFLWPLPMLLGLAALSVLYRDRETITPTDT